MTRLIHLQLWHVFATLAVCLPANFARAADFDLQLVGSPADARPAQTEGALLLMGGGGPVEEAYRWFLRKAGGGDIVVLKASDRQTVVPDTFGAYLKGTLGGCDSVTVITFHNRRAAGDPQVLAAIQHAEGIFLGGGKQFLYADYWKGTPVGAALDGHLRSGRPLGGSSAGLAVLGQTSYTAHVTARLTSDTALANPFDWAITLDNDFLHLDLLRSVITDSHFSQRARLGRLITFVARTAREPGAANLLGLGLDERTALCLEPDGSGRVFTTTPTGRAWFVIPQRTPEVVTAGMPLTYRDVKVIAAGPGSTVQLLDRAIRQPAAESTVSVVGGKLVVER